jgi:hypothetical protein
LDPYYPWATCPFDQPNTLPETEEILCTVCYIKFAKLHSDTEHGMKPKTEETFSILAALFVLFSALLSPIISALISIIALVGFGIYKLAQKEK